MNPASPYKIIFHNVASIQVSVGGDARLADLITPFVSGGLAGKSQGMPRSGASHVIAHFPNYLVCVFIYSANMIENNGH